MLNQEEQIEAYCITRCNRMVNDYEAYIDIRRSPINIGFVVQCLKRYYWCPGSEGKIIDFKHNSSGSTIPIIEQVEA